ncbi:MAG: cytochrome C6 [Cyanobacteriota bacterium]|nr:cytochrome C6 [Cyanobacteriota bacterium]
MTSRWPVLRQALVMGLLALALVGLALWPRPAFGAEPSGPAPEAAAAPSTAILQARGADLFGQHCLGCHVNGGNVIRRGKTLRLAALRRAGLESAADVARIAALGQGQMGGYEKALGPGGAEAVGAYVWQQALANWPKSEQKLTKAS